MRKNIVICCDGTGNEFGECNSNVVKIYTALEIDSEQVGYYHPGVGTMGAPTAHYKLQKSWSRLMGLAFGSGFRENVLDAYRYLMNNYVDGDRIYLFGFSRGAYTVRALAGLLYGYGLLCAGNEGHIPYAWKMFTDDLKKALRTKQSTADVQAGFKEAFSHKHFNLHFVGLWDTVSSIGWITEPLQLLYTAQNPLVVTGRHAVSIDERRCFYQDNLWGEALGGQDILQVWFPGAHSDVGGSYTQEQSVLSNAALAWLLREAKKVGLRTNPNRERLVFGDLAGNPASSLFRKPKHPPYFHNQLKGAWWLLEILPHRYYDKDLGAVKHRIPLGRCRHIPELSLIHPSVPKWMADREVSYKPKNLTRDALVPAALHAGTVQRQCKINADVSEYYLYDPKHRATVRSSGHKAATAAAIAACMLPLVCAVGAARYLQLSARGG